MVQMQWNYILWKLDMYLQRSDTEWNCQPNFIFARQKFGVTLFCLKIIKLDFVIILLVDISCNFH